MMCTTEKELRAAFEAEINKPACEIDIKKLDELATKLGSHPLTEDEKRECSRFGIIWLCSLSKMRSAQLIQVFVNEAICQLLLVLV